MPLIQSTPEGELDILNVEGRKNGPAYKFTFHKPILQKNI